MAFVASLRIGCAAIISAMSALAVSVSSFAEQAD
jgi:hypothetical protein